MWLLQKNQKLLGKWQMCLLQSSRGVLLPQHISRVSYIYFLFLFRFGVFLASAHVQTDTYAPDLYEKTGAYVDVFFLKIAPRGSREEKSLRHVAMVAKFLDDNKQKSFKLNRLYRMSFHLPNVGEFSGVESERTVSKFRKRKRQYLCCVHILHNVGA